MKQISNLKKLEKIAPSSTSESSHSLLKSKKTYSKNVSSAIPQEKFQNFIIPSRFREGEEYVLTHQKREDDSIYTFRHVIPYIHVYDQSVENYEGRMIGKPFKEAYCSEYGIDENTFSRMCIMGVITLNHQPILTRQKQFQKLKEGDSFQVKDIRMDRPVKHFDQLEIIYENEDFVVVTKPDGVCVHPIRRYHKNSLFYMMEHEYDQHFGNNLHCKTIHRLDRQTSGVLIVGKTPKGVNLFQKQFKGQHINKQYIAKVHGIIHENSVFEINDPIVCIQPWDGLYKSIPNREKELEYRELCKKNRVNFEPKSSITKFQVLLRNEQENTTTLLCTPITGRTHQIREHLSGQGFPIIGEEVSMTKIDPEYSEKRIDTGTEIWKYKLDLFEKYGLDSPQVAMQALQDTVYGRSFSIPQDLCLFSFRYQVGPFDFQSSLFAPEFLKRDWNEICHILKRPNKKR
ncbi:hypothetical protein C9374_008226 [Naegleria lovaniensis]|uniref:Pseudouridine synthase RsuA/RluA-like domain-containing protein n=1 Tax=Naegleria lovaniensis TaxID=51637 RepID=A0AA88GJM8_NAELO|nr:uncharacterized protein C9374_008226 [Naegleria lovaniensis]KAG2378587.1 hypothetical protein C9374_008226 [Naegleria lovaniensis]